MQDQIKPQDAEAIAEAPTEGTTTTVEVVDPVGAILADLEKDVADAYMKAIIAGASPFEVLQVGIAQSTQMLASLGIENGNNQDAIKDTFQQMTAHIGRVILEERFPLILAHMKAANEALEKSIASAAAPEAVASPAVAQ